MALTQLHQDSPVLSPNDVEEALNSQTFLSIFDRSTFERAELIENRLGVKYHRNHVGKLLHQLGWSHQKPERRAVERNDRAIEEWKRQRWPRVKKTPLGWAPT
mgnify:CR=1 FL=1